MPFDSKKLSGHFGFLTAKEREKKQAKILGKLDTDFTTKLGDCDIVTYSNRFPLKVTMAKDEAYEARAIFDSFEKLCRSLGRMLGEECHEDGFTVIVRHELQINGDVIFIAEVYKDKLGILDRLFNRRRR